VGPLHYHLSLHGVLESHMGSLPLLRISPNSSKSARDNNVDELVHGIEECYGSIVVEDDNVLILVD